MLRDPVRRVALAGIVVVTGLGFGLTGDAGANPEVCGYVRYGDETSTSTVPYITYCERPCGGVGPHVPPGEVGGFHYEALVCVLGL